MRDGNNIDIKKARTRNTVTHNGQPQIARYTYVVSFLLEDARVLDATTIRVERATGVTHNNASTLPNDLCRNDTCPRRCPREM